MPPLIRLENVSKSYYTGITCRIYPVRDVNLEVQAGERLILLGKSGSGKTTFLNLVGGVDLPTSGKVFFEDKALSSLSQQQLAMYRRKEIGFIFQSFNLFTTLTVGENVTLPLNLLGQYDEKKAKDFLSAVGLADHWNKYPEQLSGGEQQRVAIARALVKEPRVILADEPTGNLDLETGNSIVQFINDVCNDGNSALIMVTHSPEALWVAHRKFRLRSGTLVEESLS
jgi:putative ABC transport system ATP-binding protein